MIIAGICCSPRKGKTTFQSMEACLGAAAEVDPAIETRIFELAGKTVSPCVACGKCREGLTCSIDDDFGEIVELMTDERLGGFIVGSPVYMGTMTAQCKAFLDRSVMFRRNGWSLSGKVGGVLAVGASRNGGQELTLQAIRTSLLVNDVICVGDGPEAAHFGATLWSLAPGGIPGDEVGLATARSTGRRVARLALKLRSRS